MFIAKTLTDNVRIHPSDLAAPRNVSLTNALNRKYANKILPSCGLCIRVLDIKDATQGTIFACQDGAYTCRVVFRLVIFNPFIGEILNARVMIQSPIGIRVSCEFFDEITIPAEWMKGGCIFDETEKVWVWIVENEEGEENKLYIDNGELIRFRVETKSFSDDGVPFALAGSISEDGLGLVSWWEEGEEEG